MNEHRAIRESTAGDTPETRGGAPAAGAAHEAASENKQLPERVLMLAIPKLEAIAPDDEVVRQDLLWNDTLAAIRDVVPGAVAIHRGCCIMQARGPSRYYGGEAAAAASVLAAAMNACGPDHAQGAVSAVASGRFTTQQVLVSDGHATELQSPSRGVRIVAPQHTSSFLAPLPISRAVDAELATVLIGLGIYTLGAFAELPLSVVLQRFGTAAKAPHQRARGLGEVNAPEVPVETPAPDLTALCEFDSPLTSAEQLAFSCVTSAEAFFEEIRAQGLVCTELHLELRDDASNVYERSWSHPATFTASDIVNRIRWQTSSVQASTLQAPSLQARSDRSTAAPECFNIGAGIVSVRITAVRTAKAAAHEPGLWSNAPDERVHHQLTRIQSLVGYEGVVTGKLTGGRTSLDRQLFTPWGTNSRTNERSHGRSPNTRADSNDSPWPGHLPGSLPTLVLTTPPPVDLRNARGEHVRIDADDMLSATPSRFRAEGTAALTVIAWSAPWPLREQWWRGHGIIYRLQVVLENDEAWLLQYRPQRGWFAEGRYH